MREHQNDTYEWKQTAKRVRERDGGVCAMCGTDEDIQVDHIHPASLGGTDDDDNLQLLCGFHNRLKSNKTGLQRTTWFNERWLTGI